MRVLYSRCGFELCLKLITSVVLVLVMYIILSRIAERRPTSVCSGPLMSVMYKYPGNGVPQLAESNQKPFRICPELWNRTKLPESLYVNLNEHTLQSFVFVTGASGGGVFQHMVRFLVGSVHKYYPGHKILVYDMGMREDIVKTLSSLCNVEVKKFDFAKYPAHLRNMFLYSWKPILINEVLQQYPGAFWLDSSGRMTSSNITQTLKDAKRTNGITLIRNTGHSNFAVTDPRMYSYIPSIPRLLKHVQQREANTMLIYRTREVYENIVKYWVYCSLDKECIAPHGATNACSFGKSWWTDYGMCHRFDQSALNIILANYYNFDDMMYKSKDEVCTVTRGSTGTDHLPEVCGQQV